MSLSIRQAKESGISNVNISKHLIVGVTLTVALFAFEIFNFDTTRFALGNLLGGKQFASFSWAGILALAFCAIDFAGLAKIFTPEKGADEPRYVWYLMGAWLIGATMNAMMTWWAVSITLLESPGFGNEVLSREQILDYVPIFVAVLVWLTRILFIGALSIAGDQLLDFAIPERVTAAKSKAKRKPKQVSAQPREILPKPRAAAKPKRRQASIKPGRSTQRPPVQPTLIEEEEEAELVYEDPPTLIIEPHQRQRTVSAKPPKRSPQRSNQTTYRRKPVTRPNPRPRPQGSYRPQPMMTKGSDYNN